MQNAKTPQKKSSLLNLDSHIDFLKKFQVRT